MCKPYTCDVTPPPLCVPCGQWHHKHRSSLISVDGHRQHVRAGCAPSCRAVIHSLKEQYMLNFNNSNVGLWLEQRVRKVNSYLKVGNRLKWRETVLRLSRGAGCNVLHATGPRSTGRPSTSHVQQRVHWKLRVAVQNVLALSISPRCPDTRWGIILRSTVRTSDISWFSLPLLLQNGSQTDTRIEFAQKTASEKVISSILAANKCCQSTAGYVSLETNESDQANIVFP